MKRIIVYLICISISALFSPKIASAQIVINEVLNNPVGTETGAEWVELYNTGSSPASLKDCILYLDDSAESQKVSFKEIDFVDKFKTVSWDHSWLNNSGDTVRLKCPGVEELVTYGKMEGANVEAPTEGNTFGRYPDGLGAFTLLSSVTFQSANTRAFVPSLTASPINTLTVTPKPSATSKPTNTSKPTVTEKPAETLTPTSKKEVISATSAPETSSPTNVNTALFSDNTASISPAPAQVLGAKTGNRVPIASFAFMGIGVLIIAISSYPVIKKFKSGYNKIDETKE